MREPNVERITPPLRLTMFHFLCPLCGAKPGERWLRDYLNEWANSPVERVAGLVNSVRIALDEFHSGSSRWGRHRFLVLLDDLLVQMEQLHEMLSAINRDESLPVNGLINQCVVCFTPTGVRESDRYFTIWPEACGVQVQNLLYEVGLILWQLVREVPRWCDAAMLAEMDGFRRSFHAASYTIGSLRCPICRRPTTHLYGTTRSFCRWCLDMSGGFGTGIRISLDGDVQLVQPDPTRAVFEDAYLLPPLD
jgi:hypothetical protein